jgi:magnesium chelatase subunit D
MPTQTKPTPLVELPISASEDRVVGSLDLEHAVTEGQRRFEAGVLAKVHRGVLYVDEVNLLDDHLVDLLLDVAAMGVNTVEREGISISHPSRFVLVGTMNPEEGELRPQLLDRFGLAVEIQGLSDVESRIAVIERRIAYETDPETFIAHWQDTEQQLAERIIAARTILPQVDIDSRTMAVVANLSLDMNVDGHRADLTILETARAHAAWKERTTLNLDDIRLAAELALPHRMRRQPFTDITEGGYRECIASALERSTHAASIATDHAHEDEKKKDLMGADEHETVTAATPQAEWDGSPQVTVGITTGAEGTGNTSHNNDHDPDTGSTATYDTSNDIFRPRMLDNQRDRKQRRAPGRRSSSQTSRKDGRYIASRCVQQVTDLALDATLREAAPHQRHRQAVEHARYHNHMRDRPVPKIIVYRDDLRQKVRIRRTRNAVCFVVDASWSMAAEERMQATRTAILSLLHDAYQRRDYVGLVSFQRTYATVLLPLTNSVERAQKCLQSMPVGGKTPLARGLLTAYEMLEQARRQDPEVIPLMVVITDGQANVAMGNTPPQQEAFRVAHFIAASNMRTIVIDTEGSQPENALGHVSSAHVTRTNALLYAGMQRGQARKLAEQLQGHYHRLDDLKDGGLVQMVRKQMNTG